MSELYSGFCCCQTARRLFVGSNLYGAHSAPTQEVTNVEDVEHKRLPVTFIKPCLDQLIDSPTHLS